MQALTAHGLQWFRMILPRLSGVSNAVLVSISPPREHFILDPGTSNDINLQIVNINTNRTGFAGIYGRLPEFMLHSWTTQVYGMDLQRLTVTTSGGNQ